MIGFYNASVILTYLGVVSAVFGMSQALDDRKDDQEKRRRQEVWNRD